MSAKKVMKFVDSVVHEEKNYHRGDLWTEADMKSAMFKAIVQWDQMVRSDFTTGMDVTKE